MKILIFNWKDPANPAAGGAETFTHQVAKRWVSWGNEVTLFCSGYSGAPADDGADGVRTLRRGGQLTVYREATRWYAGSDRPRFDVVVDEINTRPFLTPRFVRDAQIVALIHQLAAEVWSEQTPFPISFVGRHFLEPRWLRRYRHIPTITVSASTARDLEALGFERIRIVTAGQERPPAIAEAREQAPTALFVGRFERTKRPGDALVAFSTIRRSIPNAQLWMVGDGRERFALERAAGSGVTFFGRVDERTRYELMARAHVLLVPGVREGWGLVVLEANSVGTPAIGYRIRGLVDSIKHDETGLLVDPHPGALAAAAVSTMGSPLDLQRLGENAKAWASRFDWDETARSALNVLQNAVAPTRP